MSDSSRYVNAKVILLGDTGVGKSGLGLVLSGQPYQPTDSTHGRNVWTLDAQEVETPTGGTQTREILLWDLAGQPGYRLIHQLHLGEVAVALLVFDSRSETDPFAGREALGAGAGAGAAPGGLVRRPAAGLPGRGPRRPGRRGGHQGPGSGHAR